MSPELGFGLGALVFSACKLGAIYRGSIKKAGATIDPLPWALWMVLGFVTLGSQIVEMKWQSALLFTAANIAINMAVLWIARHHDWGSFSRSDWFIIGIACVGIVLWISLRDASYGLVFCLLADAVGAGRIWWKAWWRPYSELVLTWFFGALAAVSGYISAVYSSKNTALWYPGYVIVNASGAMLIIIARRAYPKFCIWMTGESLAKA